MKKEVQPIKGTVKNGKLKLDDKMLKDIAGGSVNANASFVAVNAPFDPIR